MFKIQDKFICSGRGCSNLDNFFGVIISHISCPHHLVSLVIIPSCEKEKEKQKKVKLSIRVLFLGGYSSLS